MHTDTSPHGVGTMAPCFASYVKGSLPHSNKTAVAMIVAVTGAVVVAMIMAVPLPLLLPLPFLLCHLVRVHKKAFYMRHKTWSHAYCVGPVSLSVWLSTSMSAWFSPATVNATAIALATATVYELIKMPVCE